MPVCGNYLFFELPKKIVLNPKDGKPQHSFPFFHIAGTFASCGTPGPFSLLHSSMGIFTHTSLTKINEKAIIIKLDFRT